MTNLSNQRNDQINNFVNPLWIEPSKLPSGFNRSSLLFSIRKRLWPKKAFDLAKLSVQKEFSRANQGTNTKFRLDRSIGQIKAKISDKVFDINFYPSWWLVFVYLGRPIGQSYCRDGFKSGLSLVDTDLMSRIRGTTSRPNRRAIDVLTENNSKKPRTHSTPTSENTAL